MCANLKALKSFTTLNAFPSIVLNSFYMARHDSNGVAKWFFLIAGALIVMLFWRIISPFMIALITAAVFAIVFSPLDKWLYKYVKNKKLTAFILLVGILFAIVLPLFTIIALMVQQATDLIREFGGADGFREIDLANSTVLLLFPEVVQEQLGTIDIATVGTSIVEWVFENLAKAASATAGLLFQTFIFFISLYYFLADRDHIYKTVLELSPFKDKLDAKIVDRITHTVRSVVQGALIVAIIQAIFASIGMTIFGVPGAFIWGALIIVAAQVPLVGVGLVMIPAVGYLFITGHPQAGIGLAIWSVVIVGLVDNILSPFLIGGKTKMHNLLVLLSILGGIRLFGPIGLIVGPTVLAGVMIIVDLYRSGVLEKGISTLKS